MKLDLRLQSHWPVAASAEDLPPSERCYAGGLDECGADLNRLLGRPRPGTEVATQLKGLLFPVGFQF